MARMLSCDARLLPVNIPQNSRTARYPYMSKLSFQYGFSVFLMTEVVRVCSPPIVATANGSGNPIVGYISTIGAIAWRVVVD